MAKRKVCTNCSGKFGLIRHYNGFNSFCSKKCKEQFLERRERERREQRQFLAYLQRPT